MIRRPARCERCNAVKAELGEIQPVDKHIDRPHRIVLAHILIQHRRKQRALLEIRPLNKPLHPIPRKIAGNLIARITPDRAFSHSPDPKLPSQLPKSMHWVAPQRFASMSEARCRRRRYMNGEDHRCSDANFSRASEEAEYLFVALSATLAVSAKRSESKHTSCPPGLPLAPYPIH